MLAPSLYNISTHTFTSCGCTGLNGPTFSNNYYGVTWSNYITSSGTKPGVQLWTAPLSTAYNFEVAGCAGVQFPGASTGAIMRGDLFLQKGQQIQILVGQYGGANFEASGSGGTFIADMSNNPLIVAGGGAGNVNSTSNASASITTSARNSTDANGGSNGYGGISLSGIIWGYSNIGFGGGGGFYGDATFTPFGGYGFVNGGKGGFGSNGWLAGGCDGRAQVGGFGGGGGVSATCAPPGGGGGGYTGGAGSTNWYGGGGGSYSIALNQSNTELDQGNSGAGYVKITFGKSIDSNRPVSFDELRQRIGSNAGPISMSQVYGRFLGVSSSGNIGISDIIGKPINVGITPTKTSNAFVLGAHNMSPWNITFPSSNASWIWYTSGAQGDAPYDTIPVVFEKVVYQSNSSSINATINYGVDNFLYITLNGSFVGSTGTWTPIVSSPIVLLPGSNLFEFYASNAGGPAGLIYSVVDTNSNVLAISDSNTMFSTAMSINNKMYLGFDAANTGITAPNTTMTNWRNTSWMGPTYNATASNGPVLRYNNRWYVEFNRTNSSHFNINTSIPHLLNTWGGFTAFVVGQMTNTGSYERFFDFGNGAGSNNIIAARYGGNTSNTFDLYNGGTSLFSNGVSLQCAMDSNWYIWTYAIQVSSSNTAVTVYRNGSNVASTSSATLATDRTATINYLGRSHWVADAYLTGNISEYRFYQGFLNSTVVNELYNNLRVKWNL